jgi:hypothetical protein
MPQAGTTSGGGIVYGQSSTGVTTSTPNTAAASSPTGLTVGKFTSTPGWYITGAIVVSVALANTGAGPILLGVLGLALIYQVSLLLQGK